MNRIKELRQAKKLNQVQLCQILKVAQSTLSAWETERNQIDYQTLIKLSNLFNVSIDYILGISDNPNPPDPHKPTTTKPEYPQEVLDLAEQIQNLPPKLKALVEQQIKVYADMDKKYKE